MKSEKDITINAKYNIASEWLISRGYSLTYSNHPSSDIREFHFIKNKVRIKVFINEEVYYCTAVCQLNSDPVCTLNTGRYMIHNEDIFDAINVLVKSKEKIDSTKRMREPVIQTGWEFWFVSSVVVVIVMLFLGTIEDSKTFLPYWPYFLVLAFINLLTCLYYGTRPIKD
jgi:hypothetical protein